MAGITSDLAKKYRDHPQMVSGWSQEDFRRNIAGPHGKSTHIHFRSNLSNNYCQMDKKNEEA